MGVGRVNTCSGLLNGLKTRIEFDRGHALSLAATNITLHFLLVVFGIPTQMA